MYPCNFCERAFHTYHACEQHMRATGHKGPLFSCQGCSSLFISDEAANDHMDSENHWTYTCDACDFHFRDAVHLDMHMNSNVHRPVKHQCPFCDCNFATPSAVVHHLESKCCRAAVWMNLGKLHDIILNLDPQNLLTIPVADPEDYPVIVDQASGDGHKCGICSRVFGKAAGLKAHLKSPVHRVPIYHCVNSPEQCDKQFVTLAALWNHLESEACGIMWFEDLEVFHENIKSAVLSRRIITPFDVQV